MAATGKTPILLYGSTTATNAPVAGNLTNSSDGCEIAINVADKNLFFKDSTNVVNTVPIRQSSASSNGWLSSTDWSTFNGKAPAVTYTDGYIPFGQGTTTPNQSANLFWDNTNVRLGIGTNAPGTVVDVRASTAIATITSTTGTNYSYLRVNNTGGAQFYGIDSSTGTYTGTAYANMLWSNTNTPYIWINNYAEQMRLTTGNLQVTGNFVVGTSGKGIDFSATAGTGTSELLDDYEEGTWTPVVGGSTTNPTVAYSSQSGTYTKVGRLVTATGIIVLSSTSGGSGNVRITGLPYTNGGQANVGYIGFANNYRTAKPSKLIVFGAESQVTPYYDSSATASAQLPVSFLTSTSAIYFTVQYETA